MDDKTSKAIDANTGEEYPTIKVSPRNLRAIDKLMADHGYASAQHVVTEAIKALKRQLMNEQLEQADGTDVEDLVGLQLDAGS